MNGPLRADNHMLHPYLTPADRNSEDGRYDRESDPGPAVPGSDPGYPYISQTSPNITICHLPYHLHSSPIDLRKDLRSSKDLQRSLSDRRSFEGELKRTMDNCKELWRTSNPENVRPHGELWIFLESSGDIRDIIGAFRR